MSCRQLGLLKLEAVMADQLLHRSLRLHEPPSVVHRRDSSERVKKGSLFCLTHQIPKLAKNTTSTFSSNWSLKQTQSKLVLISTCTNMTFKRQYLPFIFSHHYLLIKSCMDNPSKAEKTTFVGRSKLRTRSNWLPGEETIGYVENRAMNWMWSAF